MKFDRILHGIACDDAGRVKLRQIVAELSVS